MADVEKINVYFARAAGDLSRALGGAVPAAAAAFAQFGDEATRAAHALSERFRVLRENAEAVAFFRAWRRRDDLRYQLKNKGKPGWKRRKSPSGWPPPR